MQAIRAPRGTTLSCKGWVQEAALRMLMNNLDPEVAERPEDLVVYGGTGKAARDWESLRPHRRERCARSATTRRCSCSRGKPVGVLRTHPDAPRVLIANSNLVGTLGHLGPLPRPRGEGPHDVRPDDRRLVDLHRHARGSCRAPTRPSRRRAARTSAPPTSPAGWSSPAGLGGMGGAQPLAATHDRRGLPRRGGRPGPRSSGGSRPATSTCAPTTSTTRWRRLEAAPRGAAAALGRRWSATRPGLPRARRGAASRPTSSPTRPPRTIR